MDQIRSWAACISSLDQMVNRIGPNSTWEWSLPRAGPEILLEWVIEWGSERHSSIGIGFWGRARASPSRSSPCDRWLTRRAEVANHLVLSFFPLSCSDQLFEEKLEGSRERLRIRRLHGRQPPLQMGL
ncbi:hypothetical protein V6N11_060176 [Hibiscus sabdariffa]|uniref:Uncharacterized protein n=1 Tax=Hibiscus sabdariffa TaxID=183260 RepID=A0ABR2P385_9ROSI